MTDHEVQSPKETPAGPPPGIRLPSGRIARKAVKKPANESTQEQVLRETRSLLDLLKKSKTATPSEPGKKFCLADLGNTITPAKDAPADANTVEGKKELERRAVEAKRKLASDILIKRYATLDQHLELWKVIKFLLQLYFSLKTYHFFDEWVLNL